MPSSFSPICLSNTDLLLNLFTFLHDIKIINKEAFVKWFNDDKKDRLGNAIALVHMKRFINKLEEADDS